MQWKLSFLKGKEIRSWVKGTGAGRSEGGKSSEQEEPWTRIHHYSPVKKPFGSGCLNYITD